MGGHACEVLALDPGDTTGWCAVLGFSPPAFEVGEVPMEQVTACILQHAPAEVVLEGWRVYPWAAKGLLWNRLEPVQLIGAIKWLCLERGIPWVEQAASIKAVISRAMLQTFDLWKPTCGKPHARDAARHALYRLWTTRQEAFVRYLAGGRETISG